MKIISFLVLCGFLAPTFAAPAIETLNPDKDAVANIAVPGASSVKSAVEDMVDSAPTIADKDLHLLAQTGKDKVLFNFSEKPAQQKAFIDDWSARLIKNGFKVTKTETTATYTAIYYDAGGLVIRDFFAESYRMFKPKDEKARRDNMITVINALEKAGMPVIAVQKTNLSMDACPNYKLYYLTKPAARLESEMQLRILNEDNVDFDALRKKGVNVVQTFEKYFMVYIDRQITMPVRWSKTQEGIQKKLTEAKELFAKDNIEMLDYRIGEYDVSMHDYAKYYLVMYIRWN